MRILGLILIVFCISVTAKNRDYDSDGYYIEVSKPNHGESTVNALVPGTFLGASIGFICAFLDHHYPKVWPLTWLFLGIERELLEQSLSNNTYHHGNNQKQAMKISSLLASWVTYLITLDHLGHR